MSKRIELLYPNMCPIWETDCRTQRSTADTELYVVHQSFRAGGAYQISADACEAIPNLVEEGEKARLTSMLVGQWIRGVNVPRLTAYDVQRAKESQPLPVNERAERLLIFLATSSPGLGEVLELADPDHRFFQSQTLDTRSPSADRHQSALAWSESLDGAELDFLTDYLANRGWITKETRFQMPAKGSIWHADAGSYGCRVEVPGYSRIEALEANPDSSQCFVAMWFDPSMEQAYEKGIKPAIEEAGFTPIRVDQEEYLGKVDDKIIAEIKRSRFVVADFTHKKADIRDGKCHETEEGHLRLGARGGVYYEAGFAEGFGLDVIPTCRSDMINDLHFDTRQLNHIVWNDVEDLRERLTHRIRRVIRQES